MADRGDVPPSRASTRLSRASTQARIEIDEVRGPIAGWNEWLLLIIDSSKSDSMV